MAKAPTVTAPIHARSVEFLGLQYAGAGFDRLRDAVGDEARQVEIQFNPRDLRSIVVRHRPSGFVDELRCTDQIYAVMTNVDIQTALLRRAKMRELAEMLGHPAPNARPESRSVPGNGGPPE